ncbi:hypothetical protein QFZ72_000840 [Bacillus sp. V2I10]|nr:hypothetical protein [Bacillus sp. V2I10]
MKITFFSLNPGMLGRIKETCQLLRNNDECSICTLLKINTKRSRIKNINEEFIYYKSLQVLDNFIGAVEKEVFQKIHYKSLKICQLNKTQRESMMFKR